MNIKLIRFFVLIASFSPLFVLSQTTDILTLETCYDSMMSNYPIVEQRILLEKMRDLKIKNIRSDLKPQLIPGAQSSIQSNVPHIDKSQISYVNNIDSQYIDGGKKILNGSTIDFPIPPLWQNKIYIDLSQVIYDGGITRGRTDLEKTQSDIQQKSLEIELYNIRENIHSLYFNLLYLKENKSIIETIMKQLESRLKIASSGAIAGMVAESTLNSLKAEIIKLEQTIIEVETNEENLCLALSKIIRREITKDTKITFPSFTANIDENAIRPELELLQMQITGSNQSIDLLKAMHRPKIMLFGQTGYGKPGLNMLSNEFELYGIAGVRLQWNILDWGNTRRSISIAEYQKQMIHTKVEQFSLNQSIAMDKERNNMLKYENILAKDNEIIRLRSSVSRSAESAFDNGTISTPDYLSEKYAEMQAMINKSLHLLLLEQTKLNYLTLAGKPITFKN